LKRFILAEVVLLVLYVFDVVALPFSHLNFWLLTLAFSAASAELALGKAILPGMIHRSVSLLTGRNTPNMRRSE